MGGTALFRGAMRENSARPQKRTILQNVTVLARCAYVALFLLHRTRDGADLESQQEVTIMNRSQKVRHSTKSMQRCGQEGIIVYPAANQQGCATIPFEFAQAAEQRETVKLQRRAVTENDLLETDPFRSPICA